MNCVCPPPACQHPNKQYTGAVYDGPAGCKTFLYYTCPDCKAKLKEEETQGSTVNQCEAVNRRGILHARCGRGAGHAGAHYPDPEKPNAGWWPRDEEPPLTPEEEEEAPEDEPRCTCGETACESELCDCDSEPCPVDHAREAPEGPEYEKCVCGHIVPEHEPHGGLCFNCECPAYRTEPDFELPPQPDRRPPYVVAYSVQGHLYEVALPGDATVRAVDGALVIQHHLAPVAGIVSVLPIINEEGA